MVVVVGPSGAGKDTLMALAAKHFRGRPEVHFVRRVITRHTHAGGEQHLAVSDQGFASMEQAGSFAVWWEAHGLKYGIPAEVSVSLAQGNLVIANGSRSALHHFKAVFPRLKVITSGPIPPNPAELLSSNEMRNLLQFLSGKFKPRGKLPFALASSLQAVLDNAPDVPGYPTRDTLYPFGFGLRY